MVASDVSSASSITLASAMLPDPDGSTLISTG